jgi:hypothetical protein
MQRLQARGDNHFVYAVYRLDNVLCETNRITLSPTARIRKIATITSPIGRALIGESNVDLSRKLHGRVWNASVPSSGSVYPAFARDFAFAGGKTLPLVIPERADCVVECSFERGGPTHSNERLTHYMDELRALMTSLRLLTDTPIHGIGPFEVRFHPSIPGGGFGGGGLEDDVLGVRRLPQSSPMEISRSSIRPLKALFTRLRTVPPPNEWSAPARFRLHVAQGRSTSLDQIVDCAIGLESLFGGSAPEIRYRCAALVGRDAHDRSKIAKCVGEFFRCRNSVVHGSSRETRELVKKHTDFADETQMIDFARSVLRRACLALAQGSEITRDAFRLKCDDAIVTGRRVKL